MEDTIIADRARRPKIAYVQCLQAQGRYVKEPKTATVLRLASRAVAGLWRGGGRPPGLPHDETDAGSPAALGSPKQRLFDQLQSGRGCKEAYPPPPVYPKAIAVVVVPWWCWR